MISVRPTEEDDLAGLSALFEARFDHPLALAEWTWKYRQVPGRARSLVAVDAAGTVVAHGGALCLPARWRGGEGGIWQLVDFAGSAAGRGLRPALVELGRRLLADLPGEGDAPWIFGFPSDRHFRLGERVFGYRPLASVAPLAGPLPETPPGTSAATSAGAAGGAEPWSGDRCGDWAEAIWERCAVLGVRRSAAFLDWRYWARPHRYYRVFRLRQDGVEGLAVFAFVGEEAWAAELWLPPGAEWYAPLLAVAAELRRAGLRRWRFWPPPARGLATDATSGAGAAGTAGDSAGLDAACLLGRLGVHPEGEPRFVGCRGAAHGRVDPVAAAAGFHYSMGDYDLA